MKLRHVFRYPIDIVRAKQILRAKQELEASFCGRPITLDLYTPDLLIDCGRHLAAIAQWANEIESRVLLRCHKILLAAISRKPFGATMLRMNNVDWIDTNISIPLRSLILTDIAIDRIDRSLAKQQIVQMLIGKDILDHCPTVPYPMHPNVAPLATKQQLAENRRTEGRRGILFAGSQRAKYGRHVIRRDFGVLNRLEILSTLRASFPHRIAQYIGNYKSHEENPIVLPEPSAEGVSTEDWLPTLAEHQFFLACPGIAQPLCHNLIESMSVGTIPIIESNDRLRPELQDGVNAICFRGFDGLRDAIHRIDQLSTDQVSQLSVAAAEFYDQHLSGRKFLAEMADASINGHVSQVCMPFHSENLYEPSDVRTALPPAHRRAA